MSRRKLIVAAPAMALLSAAALSGAQTKERVIKIVAKKFEFVPETIRVKKGETVVLHFTAPEVPMGAFFTEMNQRVDIMPGKVAKLRITPTQTGSFTYLCDVFCGNGHEEMSGTLVVT
jgi:cytochrome c oxidase subunit II